jgi:hypothetical protein
MGHTFQTLLTASQQLHVAKYTLLTGHDEIEWRRKKYLTDTLIAILSENVSSIPECESPFE